MNLDSLWIFIVAAACTAGEGGHNDRLFVGKVFALRDSTTKITRYIRYIISRCQGYSRVIKVIQFLPVYIFIITR